jgi:hypothetical protein
VNFGEFDENGVENPFEDVQLSQRKYHQSFNLCSNYRSSGIRVSEPGRFSHVKTNPKRNIYISGIT